MSTVAKILVVVNLFLAAGFLAAAATYLSYQDHWAAKYKDRETYWTGEVKLRESDITKLKSQLNTVQGQVNAATNAQAAAEANASQAQTQNNLLREAHKQASASLASATRSLEAAQETIKAQETMINTLQEARQKLTDAANAANDAKAAAIQQLNQLQVAHENLGRQQEETMGQLTDAKTENERLSFQLAAFREKYPGADVAAEAPPPHTGRVLAVDPETNVIVVSLGDEDKVKAGFKYIVSRGSQYIATLEITKTEAKKSAARSVRDLQKSAIAIGDTVLPAR